MALFHASAFFISSHTRRRLDQPLKEPVLSCLPGQHLIDAVQSVQRPGKADIRQAAGQGGQQDLPPIAYRMIASHMSLDLGLTAALGGQNGKGQQLPLPQVKALAGIKITKTIGGEIVLYVFLVVWGGCPHSVDAVSEDGLLGGNAIRQTASVTVCPLAKGSRILKRDSTSFTASTATSAFPRPM